jgi:hypothetical protein
MVIYVAIIAILNLGLGYLLAQYMAAGRQSLAAASYDCLDDDASLAGDD